MTDTIQVHNLRRLAIKGSMAKPNRTEVPAGPAVIQGDKMTVTYKSSRQITDGGRRVVQHSERFVFCERRWNEDCDDYWWVGVRQNTLSYTDPVPQRNTRRNTSAAAQRAALSKGRTLTIREVNAL